TQGAVCMNRVTQGLRVMVALVPLIVAAPAGAERSGDPPDAFPADVAVARFELLYDLVKHGDEWAPPAPPHLRRRSCLRILRVCVAGLYDLPDVNGGTEDYCPILGGHSRCDGHVSGALGR